MKRRTEQLYQALLRDKLNPISIRLRRTFSDWVEAKGLPRIEAGVPRAEHTAGEIRLTVRQSRDCGSYTLEEPSGAGSLRTRVVYAEAMNGVTAWAIVTVDQLGETEVQPYAPGFVPAYLRTAHVTDGRTHLPDSAWVVSEDEVDHLTGEVLDPQRRVPIIVVSPDERGREESREHADYLATAIAGTAVVAFLADRRTQDRFNRALGNQLEVYGGGIRTYYGPLNPADPRTPFLHPVTGGPTLRSQGREVLDRIADRVIGETARRALPEDVQRMRSAVYRVLSGRAEPSELVQAAHSPPPTVDPAREELRRKLLAVTVQPAAAEPAPAERPEPERAVNGKPALAADAKPARAENPPAAAPAATPDLAELVDAVADTVVTKLKGEIEAAMDLAIGTRESEILTRIRALDDRLAVVYRMLTELRGTDPPEARHAEELERLRTENELLWEEYGEADAIARKQAARIRWLERRLAEAGQQVHGVTGEDVFEPEGMREMLDHARKSLTHVVIGDTDEAAARLDLDYPEQRRTWAAKAWDALCALEDFARARSSGEFAGGFYDWCANGPAGRRTISTRMIAMRESRTVVTRAKFSEPRTFRVPESVAPGGQVMMEAHIKLRPVGYPAPRIYFYDDSGGATGKVYVGYIGDHLPNTRTN